jgi:hypothetical protein
MKPPLVFLADVARAAPVKAHTRREYAAPSSEPQLFLPWSEMSKNRNAFPVLERSEA